MKAIVPGMALALAAMLPFTTQAHDHGGHGAHGGHAGAGHDHAHGMPAHLDPASAEAPEGVSVNGCWIRAMPNRLPAAAYFTLVNSGAQDAVLIGAQAEGFGRVMLHAHESSQGMARMVHADKVSVPAGGKFEFAPGGHHVMLEKPSEALEVGTHRPITLRFEDQRAITAQCDVRPPGTM